MADGSTAGEALYHGEMIAKEWIETALGFGRPTPAEPKSGAPELLRLRSRYSLDFKAFLYEKIKSPQSMIQIG